MIYHRCNRLVYRIISHSESRWFIPNLVSKNQYIILKYFLWSCQKLTEIRVGTKTVKSSFSAESFISQLIYFK